MNAASSRFPNTPQLCPEFVAFSKEFEETMVPQRPAILWAEDISSRPPR
jgi:hypothetical protein